MRYPTAVNFRVISVTVRLNLNNERNVGGRIKGQKSVFLLGDEVLVANWSLEVASVQTTIPCMGNEGRQTDISAVDLTATYIYMCVYN